MAGWTVTQLRETLSMVLGKDPSPAGVGIRAFPRLGPGFLLDGYRIFCFLNTADLPEIRTYVPVECLQKASPSLSGCRDTFSLLSHPHWKPLNCLPKAGSRFLVYQQTPGLRDLARDRGWILLASPPDIRIRWQNKSWFRCRLHEQGFPVAPWLTIRREHIIPRVYRSCLRKWGPRMVLQIPDFPRGGGRATFFLEEEEDLLRLSRSWQKGQHRNHPFEEVMLSPRIEGPSLSVAGCVTPRGILQSPLQTQLLDLDQVLPPGRGGRFCGHQWGVRYPLSIEMRAREMVRWVGEALYQEGYLGIFGLDFVLDSRTDQLYALECNPRYTGAFPVLTLLQIATGALPLEAFHILAWFDATPSFSREVMEQTSVALPSAAQILLYHREETPAEIRRPLAPGRYRWSPNEAVARRIGPALPLSSPPWNAEEFYIVDGPLLKGSWVSPGEELEPLLRVVFLRTVLDGHGALDMETRAIMEWIYGSLGLLGMR